MKLSVFYHHVKQAAIQEEISESQIFARLREAGIRGLEVDRDDITDPESFSRMIEMEGMEVACIYGFYEFAHRDQKELAQRHMEVARSTGARQIMIVPGFHTGEGILRNLEHRFMVKRTAKLAKAAKEAGITPLIEDFDHLRSPINSSQGMQSFLKAAPELKVAFDTGNFIFSGEDPAVMVRTFRESIRHVHCKDRKTTADYKYLPSAVGAGVLPMEEIVEFLLRQGYAGYFAIEHFDSEHYLEDMLASARWLLNLEAKFR